MSMRYILLAVGAIIVFSIVGSAIARPGGEAPRPSDVVDVGEGTPASEATPGRSTDQPAKAEPAAQPSPTPREIRATGLAQQGPILLLNPASAKPGSSIGVSGGGFDAGATVDLFLKRSTNDANPQGLGFVQADQSGSFASFSFSLPAEITTGAFIVEARQRQSDKVATADGQVAGDVPQIKLGTQVGQPGAEVAFAASGFAPQETVEVHWNSLASPPITSFQTDQSGGVQQASLRIPFGAVGINTLIFMGQKSQSPVTVNFQMLNLFPVVELSSYALKADQTMAFTGTGFGPNERILVYLNNPNGPPIGEIIADDQGSFTNAGPFRIPFELKGKNTFIFVGQQSEAPATASFDVLPYTPSVQPSTYGGRPGTSLSFYATGFARNEVVRVYVGATSDSPGTEVSCFKTDDQGNALAAGHYTIPGDTQAGTIEFVLTGDRSEASAIAAFEVMEAGGPVQVETPQQPYHCPFDDEPAATPQPSAPTAATGAEPDSQPARTVVVANTDGQGVVLRNTPRADDRTSVIVPEGQAVAVLESRMADQTTWLRVRTAQGQEGWVPAQYTQPG